MMPHNAVFGTNHEIWQWIKNLGTDTFRLQLFKFLTWISFFVEDVSHFQLKF